MRRRRVEAADLSSTHEGATTMRHLKRNCRRPTTIAAGLEPLEPRQMMAADVRVSGGILGISGTTGDDRIVIEWTPGTAVPGPVQTAIDTLRVTISDNADATVLSRSFTNALQPFAFASLRVDAFAGHDTIINHSPFAGTIYGGDGNDRIVGGSGADWIAAGNGDDTIVTIGGGQRDVLWGQAGSDSFWLDGEATERIGDASAEETTLGHVHRVAGFATNRVEEPLYTTVMVPVTIGGVTVATPVTVRSGVTLRTQTPTRELDGQQLIDPVQREADGPLGLTAVRQDRVVLFSAAGPVFTDIEQGRVGDCYFMSALASIAKTAPDRIRQLVTDLGDGTFAVHFHNADGSDAVVRVDADFHRDPADGRLAYAGRRTDRVNWVSVVEKAWAYHRDQRGTYDSIADGNAPGISVERALGLPDSSYFSNGKADAVRDGNPDPSVFANAGAMFKRLLIEWQSGRAVTLSGPSILSRVGDGIDQVADNERRGQHVYMVKTVDLKYGTITLYDPYGTECTISADTMYFVSRGFRSYQV